MRRRHRLALNMPMLSLFAATAASADIAPEPANVTPAPQPYVSPPSNDANWPSPTHADAPIAGAGQIGALGPIHWIIVLGLVLGAAMTLWSLVRLLRRTGHSGWWALLMFVPVVNWISLWIWALTPNGKRPTPP